MFNIEEELKKLPTVPGVYLHKDALGKIIYVGKAVNLRNRVRQYFRQTDKADPKVRAMVSNIAEFEYITCASEIEALVLECNLIKKYMPKYNILMKDDKTYPYIKVTLSEEYPRLERTRKLERSEDRYFGPYSDSGAARNVVRLIEDIYPVKKCHTVRFPEGVRPCLNYFIGKCKGVCLGNVDRDEYLEMIDEIVSILSGKDSSLVKRLRDRMKEESDNLNYEEAARYRDYLADIDSLRSTQRATMIKDSDIDILIPIITASNYIVAAYKVRDGKLIGREIFYLDNISGDPSGSEMLSAFIKQHYTDLAMLPREIITGKHIEDESLIEELLNTVNEENAASGSDTAHKTRITVPERGDKKAVLRLAQADSVELAKSLDERAEREAERKEALRIKLSEVIRRACDASGNIPYLISDDDDREYRIEAYDISNMNGLDSVGAMVVYEGRKPVRNDYRKFRIRSAVSGDDYGSLQEVIYRRLKRAKDGDEGFSTYPDIMFIDGGLGQVNAVKTVVDAYRMAIPVVGLAKDDSHRTRAMVFSDGSEIALAGDPLLFSYAGNIQEEVHRFAITYQRGTRGKRMTRSVLEEIEGVGPKRRTELLSHFKSIDAIKSASYEELLEVDGMNGKVAENIIEFFANRK